MKVPVEYVEYTLNLYFNGKPITEIRKYLGKKFNYHPSIPLIYLWIDKYTKPALRMVQNYKPKVGVIWIVTEMQLKLGKEKVYLYDVIDTDTLFLLNSRISIRENNIIKDLINEASEIADRIPRTVFVYTQRSYFDRIEKDSAYLLEHVPKDKFADLHRVGISSNTSVYDTKTYRIINFMSFRKVSTINRFFSGLSVHYNYFQSLEHLKNKTPADTAKIDYPFHSWKDLIRLSAGKK